MTFVSSVGKSFTCSLNKVLRLRAVIHFKYGLDRAARRNFFNHSFVTIFSRFSSRVPEEHVLSWPVLPARLDR